MNEIIRKRKSVRKYDKTPLDDGALAKVRERLNNLTPLFPEINRRSRLTPRSGDTKLFYPIFPEL